MILAWSLKSPICCAETTAGTELPALGHLCPGEIGLFEWRKGMGEKALEFLQQAFYSNVLYHPGSNGNLSSK